MLGASLGVPGARLGVLGLTLDVLRLSLGVLGFSLGMRGLNLGVHAAKARPVWQARQFDVLCSIQPYILHQGCNQITCAI